MLAGAKTGTTWQFERLGYFCPDPSGGWNRTVTLKPGQAFTVPATGTTTLDFWWYPRCEDTANTQYVSIFRNSFLDKDLIATCSNDSVYEEKTFDLSSYAGKTIQLVFEVDIDAFALGSAWFYVDDVVVTNQP